MKTVVLGLGKSGISACDFLVKKGHTVIACDDKKQPVIHGCSVVLPNELLESFDGVERVIISPGIALTHPVAQKAKSLNLEVFCDIELAFRSVACAPPLMCAITGSNGKTTTTMLTCHMLNCGGIEAKSAGNIGTPLLTEIQKTSGPLVIELSSFQLETMQTAVLDAGCILNITPNHLDRHGTLEAYAEAKMRLSELVLPKGEFWRSCTLPVSSKKGYRFGFTEDLDLYSDGRCIVRFGVKEALLPEPLLGSRSYNVENFLAAYALSRHWGVSPETCVASYATFTKPKHRLQFVRTHNTIHFYDDSKATSVDAVLRAVESLNAPIVLIAGGVHKGYPYVAWQQPFKEKVRAVVLIGQAADFIEQDLQNTVPITRATSFEEAVRKAVQLAKPYDIVLLSPGCSSYDMFTSFEARGSLFQELVFDL